MTQAPPPQNEVQEEGKDPPDGSPELYELIREAAIQAVTSKAAVEIFNWIVS